MKLTVCIGSSCHVKGSKSVIEQLQSLIAANNLGDKVELAGTFCTGNCEKASASPVTTNSFRSAPLRSTNSLTKRFCRRCNPSPRSEKTVQLTKSCTVFCLSLLTAGGKCAILYL